MQFYHIGFGNFVSAGHIISIVSPESAPIKRIIHMAKEREQLIDATYGRKTAAVVICDTDHVVLSAISPEKILSGGEGERDE